MKQKTTSQIREELRKNMTKMFEKKYEVQSKSLEDFKQLYHKALDEKRELSKEIFKLTGENEALKEKVNQYEDWIHRLQEFIDIEDEQECKKAFKTYIDERQKSKELSDLMGVYCGMLSRIFSI